MNYSLKADHKAIKEQIHEWEMSLDYILWKYAVSLPNEIYEELEMVTNEMMSINI